MRSVNVFQIDLLHAEYFVGGHNVVHISEGTVVLISYNLLQYMRVNPLSIIGAFLYAGFSQLEWNPGEFPFLM